MKKLFIVLLILPICFFAGCTKTYKIKVIDNGETIYKCKAGETINFVPKGQENAQFVGWYNELDQLVTNKPINQNLTIFAKYIEIGKAYKINYILNGGIFNKDYPKSYNFGTSVDLVEPQGVNDMTFLGFYYNETKIVSIEPLMFGDITLEARWLDQNVYSPIEYNLGGGHFENDILNKYIEGIDTILPYPTREGFYFKGWFLEETFENRIYQIDSAITGPVKIFAKFIEKSATSTFISILGDSISTFEGTMPKDYATYYPLGDVDSVRKTWWYQAISSVDAKLLINNSSSGSKVTDGELNAQSMERLEKLANQNETPDVVIINMGTNDFTKKVSRAEFRTAYKNMITRIKKLYDDVDIIVLNLPYNKYGLDFIKIREEFNEVILQIANDFGLNHIDLNKYIVKSNYFDYMLYGAHPNAEGMKLIANKVSYVLKKDYLFI